MPIQVLCSGRVSPMYILSAFNKGADGVLVSGCHPAIATTSKGNFSRGARSTWSRSCSKFVGLEPDRFRMSWVSAAEGAKYAEVVKDFVKDLKALGPQRKLKAKR